MATKVVDGNGSYEESDSGDSQKRALDSELDMEHSKISLSGSTNWIYHFKILVPSVAAGAIIGKGGETIAQLQKETEARVKMSRATDFYPGTTERVCLISGSVDSILQILEFIMEKIKEKPNPNAKMAIDFDHNLSMEREKQVKILVPNSTAGMIIGKAGSYIKKIKEESGAYVQISQKPRNSPLAERCITVIGEFQNNKIACSMILTKIVEDPHSGSCLNVTYADMPGPVANFHPTGSPFANSESEFCDAPANGSTSYTSNDSISNLSPTIINNFHSPHTNSGIMAFSGIGINGSEMADCVPSLCAGEIIERMEMLLRGSGYSEQAISEIHLAMQTLANYGLLLSGLNVLNGINSSAHSETGILNSSSSSSVAHSELINRDAYTTSNDVENMEPSYSCSSESASHPVGTISAVDHYGNLDTKLTGLGPRFSSPRISGPNNYYMQTEDSVFEPFQRSSPALASPSAAALPINNSFRFKTDSSSDSSFLKSPVSCEWGMGNTARIEIEIEVGENIVGAILGPGGKALMEIKQCSGANIQISKKGVYAPGTHNRVVTITGLSNSVNTAHCLIKQRIAEEETKRSRNILL